MSIRLFGSSHSSFPEPGEDLLEQIKEAQLEIEAARNLFANTANPLQVDQAILMEQAAQKRYSYITQKIRSQKLNAQIFCPIRPWYKRGVNNKE